MFIDSIFNELGIDRVIHAGGTKTWYGGTSLSPAVLNAMNQSTRVFCNIEDLNKSIGRYIADTTKSEAGMVTSGCSSSLVMAATACLLKKIGLEKHLPNKNYFSYNVAVQRIHFGDYTYLLKMPCLSINEYGTVNHTSISDLMECIDNNTVATYLLFGPGINQSSVSIEVIKKETEKYNIPLIVNAAAMIPPIDNLSFFINQGADLVCMSGGKALGGPQNTGLLFGRKDLVELARRNFNPNQSIGRTMKVSKESMIGLYIALKEYVKYGDTRMYKKCLEVSKKIYQALKISKNYEKRIMHDDHTYFVPTIVIKSLKKEIDLAKIQKNLLKTSPKIFCRYDQRFKSLEINPINICYEDIDTIAKKINEAM